MEVLMCIFCKIANKEIPSTIVYENDDVICFDDIHPSAPVHVLIVPKRHFDDIIDLSQSEDGAKSYKAILDAIPVIADIKGTRQGFRVINNCGEDGGQTVMHVHFHLLGGKKLNEKIL
jgi:histidine triad (HIT) family protein